MSSSIWTRCGAGANAGPLAARAHRCVEAQHVVGTRKLVDSAAEHERLEALIERAKPPLPREPAFEGLHYLLATSFRYPPLRHGSRFGARSERALWYGAERRRTAFAEVAYYRLVFLDGTAAELGPVSVEVTLFEVPVGTDRGVDLTAPPFAAFEAQISSPVSYAESQALGAAMRADGVLAFRYRSARDRERGTNLALFDPAAFGAKRPSRLTAWHCTATRAGVEVFRKDVFRRDVFTFPRAEFEVDGRLPLPAL